MDLPCFTRVEARLRDRDFDLATSFTHERRFDKRLLKHFVVFGLRHDLHPDALELEIAVAVLLGIFDRFVGSNMRRLAIRRAVGTRQRTQKRGSLDALFQPTFKEGAGIGLERRRLDLQKVDLRLAEFDLVVFVDPTEDILTESVSFVSFLRRKMHQIPLIVEPHI